MKTMQILLLVMGVMLFSCKQENTTKVEPIETLKEVDTLQKYLFSTPETWNAIQQDFSYKKDKITMIHKSLWLTTHIIQRSNG